MDGREMVPTDGSRNPVVFTKNGEVFASSRDVAAFFGKQHAHVMRDIDNLLKNEPSLRLSKFGETSTQVPMPNGGTRTDRTFDMTRDGFTLLAMGFTGAKALKWKLRYIEAFNAMEAELRRVVESAPAIDLNDPASLRGLLLTYSEKTIELERKVAELQPSKAALDRIANADGSHCITDAAKALQMQPKRLFDWLHQNGWIYRRPGGKHWIAYSSRTLAGLLEHKVTTVQRPDGTEKVSEQVRVTARGLTRLSKLIGAPALEF